MAHKEIRRIYKNLMAGEIYGHVSYYRDDYPDEERAGKEYFSFNLGKHYCKPLFCWTHYGSSANGATLQELAWLIHVIFKMSAKRFEKEYMTKTAFIEKYGRAS